MKKAGVLLAVLALLPLAGSPAALFEKPEPGARRMVVDSALLVPSGKTVRKFVPFHPLARMYTFAEAKFGPVTGYLREGVHVKSDGRGLRYDPPFPAKHAALAVVASGALLFLLYRGRKKGFSDSAALLIPVVVRQILVLSVTGRWPEIVTAAADEPGYFAVIRNMLDGVWCSPWSFTVGLGFLYLPFVLLTGAGEFYDIVPAFNYFSALVFGPGILLLFGLVLRRLGVSGRKTCIAMLCYAVWPAVAFHFEDWTNGYIQSFFQLPLWSGHFNGWFFYAFCINSGFNAMSDTPCLLVAAACLYFALAMPPRTGYAALFGALYGFACLLRINSILLAPLFAFLLFCKFRESRRLLAAAALGSTGTFLAVFAVQFVCNTLQFGSPLTFGYVLHYASNAPADRPAAGFTWHTFSQLAALRGLMRGNLPVFAVGTAALWVMRDRFRQAVLVLLSVPVVLFFCGYSHTYCDLRRFVFPAFAGFLMAVAAVEIWDSLKKREKVITFLLLAGMVVLTLPYRAHWRGVPLALGDGLFLRLVCVVIPVALAFAVFRLIRRKNYAASGFVFLAACFYYSPPEVLAAGMFLLLLWIAVRPFLPQIERMLEFSPGGKDLSCEEKGA
ncbi:MAG: hypothetical protein IJS01_15150 [Lentisphaeria bacterium]|nr:hypothetical protein [Lentisphaeria bacterium]